MKLTVFLLFLLGYAVTSHCTLIKVIIPHPGGIGGIFKGPNSETIVKGPDGSVITSGQEGAEVRTNLQQHEVVPKDPTPVPSSPPKAPSVKISQVLAKMISVTADQGSVRSTGTYAGSSPATTNQVATILPGPKMSPSAAKVPVSPALNPGPSSTVAPHLYLSPELNDLPHIGSELSRPPIPPNLSTEFPPLIRDPVSTHLPPVARETAGSPASALPSAGKTILFSPGDGPPITAPSSSTPTSDLSLPKAQSSTEGAQHVEYTSRDLQLIQTSTPKTLATAVSNFNLPPSRQQYAAASQPKQLPQLTVEPIPGWNVIPAGTETRQRIDQSIDGRIYYNRPRLFLDDPDLIVRRRVETRQFASPPRAFSPYEGTASSDLVNNYARRHA